MASAVPESDIQGVIALVKSLLNSQLKDILRREYLAVSGVKAALQTRVINHLIELARDPHDPQHQRYERFKSLIYTTARRQLPPAPHLSTPNQTYHQQTSVPPPQLPPPSRHLYPGPMAPPHSSIPSRLSFKESPFYNILEPLTPIFECKIRENTRDTVEIRLILSQSVALRLQNDPSLRVMLYGAADNGLTQYSPCDIAFPHQVELKVNLDEVKTNLRGLKNKPGTTRPADITNYIRKKPGYPNHIVLTYALTQKKFFLVVNLVQRRSVEELVAQLKQRKTISAEQVVREMRNRAEDADIVATSSVMSLKCPLSTLRINVPCRTTLCTHNQCFDALSFLQLQEQAPTWTCPVCNKGTSFEALQIDQYVDNILKSTPSSLEQVTIEPNGDWAKPGDGGSSPTPKDDSDLVEITDGKPVVKQEATPVRFHMEPSSTPNTTREQSTMPSVNRPSSTNKRPASEVIDLTLSDEDEAPRPSPKRPAFPAPNGHPRYPSYPPSAMFTQSSSNSPDPNSYWYNR
ncbi:hypothetical protein VTO42DRAFT_674 [Malbranchea cinnamomea]